MTINLQTGTYVPPQPLQGARSADIQSLQKTSEPLPQTANADTKLLPSDPVTEADKKRYEQIMAAAQSFTGDPYPISDKSFAIFKDASGQYVTRFTSLRDGRVTYVPELRLLQQFESQQRALKAVVHLQA